MKKYYTYAYLREDRTPYYIGKGTNWRMYDDRGKSCNKPKDKSRIIVLKRFDSEFDAYKHEMYMINVFGRKDLGTGILHNRTDGGDGPNAIRSDEWRLNQSISQSGKKLSENHKKRIGEGVRGLKRSDEAKKKYSDAAKKRWANKDDERRKKLVERNKSLDNREKVKQSMKEMWEKREPEEKEKIISNLRKISNDEDVRKKLKEKNKEWWSQNNENTKERKEKLIERNKSYKGLLYWNDGQEQVRSVECPGINWKRGRLKKLND